MIWPSLGTADHAEKYALQGIHPENLPCVDVRIVTAQAGTAEEPGYGKDILNGPHFEHPAGMNTAASLYPDPSSFGNTTSSSQLPTSQAYSSIFPARSAAALAACNASANVFAIAMEKSTLMPLPRVAIGAEHFRYECLFRGFRNTG
jgi:hypothetical protein